MLPLISVLMPYYNEVNFFEKAYRSILNQTYNSVEIIIVDDGSTIPLSQNFRSILHENTKVIRNEKNSGICYSLNRAASVAQGSFLARMDSDDISEIKRLEIQLNYMIQNEIKICGTGASVLSSEEKIFTPEGLIEKVLPYKNPLVHPSLMFEAKTFHEIGGYKLNGPAQDYEIISRYFKNGYRIGNISDPLISYRRHENSVTSRKNLQQQYNRVTISLQLVFGKNFKYISFMLPWVNYISRMQLRAYVYMPGLIKKPTILSILTRFLDWRAKLITQAHVGNDD